MLAPRSVTQNQTNGQVMDVDIGQSQGTSGSNLQAPRAPNADTSGPSIEELAKIQIARHDRYAETLLADAGFADVEISCDDGALLAHKAVLVCISPYFIGQAFNDQVPGERTKIILPGLSVAILQHILEIAYRGKTVFDPSLKEEISSWMNTLGFLSVHNFQITKVNPESNDGSEPRNNPTRHQVPKPNDFPNLRASNSANQVPNETEPQEPFATKKGLALPESNVSGQSTSSNNGRKSHHLVTNKRKDIRSPSQPSPKPKRQKSVGNSTETGPSRGPIPKKTSTGENISGRTRNSAQATHRRTPNRFEVIDLEDDEEIPTNERPDKHTRPRPGPTVDFVEVNEYDDMSDVSVYSHRPSSNATNPSRPLGSYSNNQHQQSVHNPRFPWTSTNYAETSGSSFDHNSALQLHPRTRSHTHNDFDFRRPYPPDQSYHHMGHGHHRRQQPSQTATQPPPQHTDYMALALSRPRTEPDEDVDLPTKLRRFIKK